MIFEDAIVEWRQYAPWQDDNQVEQDLILTGVLQIIYADSELAAKLAFRGGTCLNKLFWSKPVRFSEDLDFVQLKEEKLGDTIRLLRAKLDALFMQEPHRNRKRDSFQLLYRFQPTSIDTIPRNIKIEINTREHSSFDVLEQKPLKLRSLWRSGEAVITTYRLEELLATKLRALYQRRKGRDLFDLWKSRSLHPDWQKVVAMFQKYMRRQKVSVHRDQLVENLNRKLSMPQFTGDISPLLTGNDPFDVHEAADFIFKKLAPLIPKSKRKTKRKGKQNN